MCSMQQEYGPLNPDTTLILEQAELLYNVKPAHEITMGNSGNRLFEVNRAETAYILRASAYSPEQKEHTAFELKWMEYLSDAIAGIVRPHKSIHNTLFEVIKGTDTSYIVYLLEKAPGKLIDINNPHEFNEDLFFRLGALMGEMHRLTIGYEGNIRKPELEWTGPVNAWRYDARILDENVRLCLQKYYDEINTLPISQDNYGIIHWDIHTGNFFVDNDNITLFDFEACQFNWYAADMASAIFFMVLKGAGPLTHKSEKERTEFAESYIVSYLKGYVQTNRVNTYWIRKIDLFMKYQMGDEYLYAQNYWPNELAHLRGWYLEWHRERITNGLPYVFIDYDKIVNSISAIQA